MCEFYEFCCPLWLFSLSVRLVTWNCPSGTNKVISTELTSPFSVLHRLWPPSCFHGRKAYDAATTVIHHVCSVLSSPCITLKKFQLYVCHLPYLSCSKLQKGFLRTFFQKYLLSCPFITVRFVNSFTKLHSCRQILTSEQESCPDRVALLHISMSGWQTEQWFSGFVFLLGLSQKAINQWITE